MPRQFVPWQMILSPLKIVSVLSALLTIYESRGLPESSLEAQDYFLVPHSYNNWITWAISWCVFWFCLISLYSWSTKPAQLSKPIKFKGETRNLVTRVFPRLELFACFYLEFLSPPCDFFLLFWLAVISILILVSTLHRFALCSRFELFTCRLTWHFVRFYNS